MTPRPILPLLSRALDAFFPGRCLHCQLPAQRNMDLCAGCEAELIPLGHHCPVCAEPLPESTLCGQCQLIPPDFFHTLAPYRYQVPLDGWINRFKHHGDLRAGRVLAQLLSRHLVTREGDLLMPDALLPMPLHWRRRLARGFNQADELARLVSAATGIAIDRRLAVRALHVDHQQGLNRALRRRNLRGVFRASPRCNGLHIAVIDDVVTTGATARALASALVDAGARSVQIWALARTPLEK